MCTSTWILKENTEFIIWILRCFQEGVFLLRPTVPKAHWTIEMKKWVFFFFACFCYILELTLSNFKSHCDGRISREMAGSHVVMIFVFEYIYKFFFD